MEASGTLDNWTLLVPKRGPHAGTWLGRIEVTWSVGAQNKNCFAGRHSADHRVHSTSTSGEAGREGVGVRLERVPSLNDDPLFIAALVDLVREHTRIPQ